MSLIDWPSTLAFIYMAVMSLVSRAAPLNNKTNVISLNSKENMAASNLSLVLAAGEILLVSDCFWLGSWLLDKTSSEVTRKLK
ncbi:hypothetical protein G9A89_002803 [Geosiphon pyriformis]|nr:hypothetical protein G9A89_002803 [Geosiphon pyriformis]